MKKFLCFLLSLMLSVPVYAAEQEWIRYVNERFGYAVEYPALFSKRNESANGDGVWLKSNNGKYDLTLSGGYNVLMQDGHAMIEAMDAKGVIKKESGSTWFRLVRRDKGQIIHSYGIINEDSWTSFTFAYPKGKDFDVIIKHMEKTLSLGENNLD